MKKSTLHIWIGVLSVALLCAQGVKLHVHHIDHGDRTLHHHTHHEKIEHSHLSIAHSVADTSHADQHNHVVAESEIKPHALLTKAAGHLPAMAILTYLLGLFILSVCRSIFLYQGTRINGFWRYHFSPPLRAPPQ